MAGFGYIPELAIGGDKYNEEKKTYMFISGVLGYNGGMFTGINGYSYVALPSKSYCLTSAITHGSISSLSQNLFYAQEFIGNNYNDDTKSQGYAMADLYGTISEYSSIYALDEVSGLVKQTIGTIQLYIPTNLSGKVSRSVENGKIKFSPFECANKSALTDNITKAEYHYFVITSNLSEISDLTIGANKYVSGRSVATGKVEITISWTSGSTKYFVGNNSGVLSNIQLKTGADNTANVIALVNNNNGIITNCYVYGLSQANHTLCNTNNGKIYSSASSIKFIPNTVDAKLYGLVLTNNGEIKDCYSSSFGYTENSRYVTTIYGFAGDNSGTIQNCAYFIPDVMKYDNVFGGNAINNTGKIANCYSGNLPDALLRRSTIWTEENGNIQIKGIKEPAGKIVIKASFNGVEVSSIASLKANVNYYAVYNMNYSLSYNYEFYVSEPVGYNVVRINNSKDFVDYINSLPNGTIPNETLVVLTNDTSTKSNEIKMNTSELSKITISTNAGIVGINTNGSANIVLDFSASGSGASTDKQQLTHELITSNSGILAGITIKNLSLVTTTQGGAFAPIMNNFGVISKVNLENVSVSSTVRYQVAGFVAHNNSGAVISNCRLTNLWLASQSYVNTICTVNRGYITNTSSSYVGYRGNLLLSGVNY